MSARTITLLIAILGTLGTLAAALTSPETAFHLSPPIALLVGTLGAGAYGVARAMQKAKAGMPLRDLFATTEAKGAVLVYLAGLVTAIAGVVPPSLAGLSAIIVTTLVAIARMYQKGSGAGPAALVLALFLTLGMTGNAFADDAKDTTDTVTASADAPAKLAINLDDIVPQITKCWGTTCVMPDAIINAMMLDLSTKQWSAGVQSIGAGLALLFSSDKVYASGIAAHITGVYEAQSGKSSFVMPTIGIVLLRYVEVGYSFRLSSDEPNRHYLSAAGNIPWDLLSGATIVERKANAMKARQ